MSRRAYLALSALVFGVATTSAWSADQKSLNNKLLLDVCCSLEIVQQDLADGADVNAKDDDGNAALMKAGNADVARALLEHGADVNAKNRDGQTALMIAAHNILGKTEVLRVLLDHRANVNEQDKEGKTALIWAAYGVNNSPEVVRVLLEHGADVNAKDKDGKTALQYARTFSHEDVAKLIIAHGVANPSKQLLQDAYLGSLEAVRLDLAHGANVNAKDKDGKTALMRSSNNVTISRLLVERRANVNAKDNTGQTALMMAVDNKNTDVVNLLLAHGADATPKDKHGRTALEYAYLGGDDKLAALISNHLPKRNAPARSGAASDDLSFEEFFEGVASDWKLFLTAGGVSYYYSPGSISRRGWYWWVDWYSSDRPMTVYRALGDCMGTSPVRSILLADKPRGADELAQYASNSQLASNTMTAPLTRMLCPF